MKNHRIICYPQKNTIKDPSFIKQENSFQVVLLDMWLVQSAVSILGKISINRLEALFLKVEKKNYDEKDVIMKTVEREAVCGKKESGEKKTKKTKKKKKI